MIKYDLCRNGHPLTPENIYLFKGSKPKCRSCNRIAVSKYKDKKYGRNPNRALEMADVALPKPIEDLFGYCEKSPTGLVWLITTGARSKKGSNAGSLNGRGYYIILRLGKSLPCHRVAWQLHHGKIPDGLLIDHINGVKTDNRIENLRLATKAQNGQNQSKQRDNTTGVKGLSWHKRVWIGQIRCNGVKHNYSSKSRSEVEDWLLKTRKELHGEYAKN